MTMNRHAIIFTVILGLAVAIPCAYAFNAPVDSAGPLTVRINGPEAITVLETATTWEVELVNEGAAPVSGLLQIEVIDDWKIEGPLVQPVLVAAGKSLSVSFTAIAGKGTYNAWYPIHVRVIFELDKKRYEVHPVLLVRTNVTDVPRPESAVPWKAITVPDQGRRSLVSLPVHRVIMKPFTGDPIVLPVGWRGTEALTRAVIHHPGAQALPETRQALFVHPPWYEGRSGSALIEMPVTLPTATPLRFECAVAIQGQMPSEPPSDGVTFRLYVAPLDAAPGVLGTLLFEKHTDSKTWEPVSVDLAAYAGKSVVLQLETHPGPKNETTCDRGLWGDISIVAGDLSVQDAQQDVKIIALGEVCNDGICYQVSAGIGKRGLLDGTVSFTSESDMLTFDGFRITVLNDALEAIDGVCVLQDVMDESRDNKCRIRHRFGSASGNFDLVGELYLVGGKALCATFALENTPDPRPWMQVFIEDAALGAWNQKAGQLYAGVGNVIRNPEPFNLHFDGHQLATSFVGFDFDNGMSLVLASDAPPSKLEVLPDSRIYTLHSPIQPDFTIIPAGNVWQGVQVWRDINGLEAAPAVEKLAGRFVFDLWWGRYGASAEALEKAFQYGLTNSAVVWHNWQRWGYDYRLPDICPPNPDFGTLEEFQRLAAVCREAHVLFAPHDNYIDFYPDAEEFSYRHIAFNKDGSPIWGWLNEGREAQAFRWNSEAMRPFLERNLEWIREFIQPTGFFIDVWSSIGPYESWTHDGKLQDRLLHRKIWGESFAWIREYLGDNAPQISESGHDQLIGYLDGAQTNHLRVDPEPPNGAPTWMTWPVHCEDAERIPWSDMAHHDRFVLHGAGYESRYRGGLRADLHGMYSDDYISTEVLTGHPGMVDAPFHRDVVRKYWLTNDLMTALALKKIETVTFDGDDLHRQQVRWDAVGDVWVNRGETPWQVDGHTLPQYGYYAHLGEVTGAIEEKDGVIVEWSKSPETWYVNARPVIPRGLPASVKLKSLTHGEGRSFEVTLEWNVTGTIEEDLVVYIHFMDDQGNILFQADGRPHPPTTEWQGTLVTTGRGTVPETVKAGATLSLQAGLWAPGNGRRPLQHDVHGNGSVRLAEVALQGDDTACTGFEVAPVPPEHTALLARMNPENTMIDFDGVITNGACRITRRGQALEIIPLPDSTTFSLQIDLSRLPFEIAAPKDLECEDNAGVIRKIPVELEGSTFSIECDADVFVYRTIPGSGL
jgi:hypothetical protein